MGDHKDRMAAIGFWTVPAPGSEARKRLDAYMDRVKDDPHPKKLFRDIFQRATALVQVQFETGAGFAADQQLREYNLEYNGRVLSGSLRDLPGSFNVVEAFNRFLPPSATFELRAERDHLFSFQHFVDWATSAVADDEGDEIGDLLAEGEIYSYNSTDEASNLLFKTEKSEEFGFASMSCIRFKNEISVILMAGQLCDLDEQTANIRQESGNMRAFPHRTHIKPDEDRALRAEPLSESDPLWKTVVLVRFDSQTKTVDARYVCKDWGKSYQVLTDDLSAYIDQHGEFFSDEAKLAQQHAVESLKDYQTLFELTKTCLLLPKFFRAHDDDVAVERHPTTFKEFRKYLKNKKTVQRVDPRYCITYRDVRALSKPATRWPDRASFTAPPYKIETSGFWRKLPIDVEGRDKSGRPIHGRTWVSQTLSWVEEAPVGPTTFSAHPVDRVGGPNPGYVYVMRSAAHERDIFKVGLTRRTSDERAIELTKSTSSPDHFLVVEEWATSDCVLAEQLIHAKLAQYRINPNREYFRAKFRVIFSAIEEVISAVEGSSNSTT